ncbi:MAG: dephospho-CoA kinase [Lentisphaerae bacterium]|nr:dephospho-CoA kinase [Lentisphaerota bacterium]
MERIGVTGGIACGKSLVGRILDEAGVPVLEADHVAHGLMAPGRAVYRAVVDAFGTDILDGAGHIDRGVLGRRVFGEAAARKRLEALVHPAVIRAWRTWLDAQGGTAAAAVIVPLLFEAGAADDWSAVICVAASRATQAARLRERGLDGEAARRRMAAQMPLDEKIELSDYVIVNDGDINRVRRQTERILEHILNGKESSYEKQ